MTTFPADFAWGTATASYQIEGAVAEDGRGTSIWDTFAHTPGKIADGTNGDVADDHYHRYAEDIALLASLGMNAYRFSIAWPRIQATGTGPLNPAGLDFYRRVAETCLEHGVTPYATLYHWDLPQALEDAGGWLNEDTAAAFRDYAAGTHDALGDVIANWITLNEPWCSAFLGYGNGVHAPGLTVGSDSLKAAHHLLLGHGLAINAMRESRHASTLGVTFNLYSVRAASDSAVDREAARRTDGLGNRLFLDPVLLGKYPDDVLTDAGVSEWFAERSEDLEVISTPVDFVGINYYSRHTAAGPSDGIFSDPTVPSASPGSERVQMVDTGAAKTQMGWEIHPDGLVDVIAMVHERARDLPIYITENGAAYADTVAADGSVDDEERRHYFEQHVEACRQAIEQGLPLQGYFAWSLMDNFEWAFGFSRRFGLVYVDYETQKRTVKKSGLWFRDFLAADRT
ncbi:MAG: GH1 family beta-glucosidase [Propionibacteriaceae bacterium]